ncbi:MAG: CocE/NonD family hydrolase [Cyanobium sp.]
MPCADGIRLACRLWSPSGEGPWPVLLMRQPYGSALASTLTYAHPHWYAQQGFLVVVQDVRGRGESEGVFGGFAQEARDGAEAVRWARALPESNGRLGTYGFSYQGLTQLLNSGGGPEDLPDCLAPAMCGLDERLDWASEGGAHWWALGLGWALQLAAQGARRRGDGKGWAAIRRSLDTGDYLHNGLALLETHDPGGMGLAWLRADPLDAQGWVTHQPADALLRRPMLLIGGWHDPHLGGVLRLWQRATDSGGRPCLHVAAWSHLQWQGGLDPQQVGFFRRYLGGAGVPPDDFAGPRSRSTGAGEIWLQDATTGGWSAFHPGTPRPCPRWRLGSGGLAAIRSDEGRLLEQAVGPAEPVVIVHDPWRPVPGRGGHLGGEALLADRTDLDQRSDVACFTSDPFSQPLQLLGRPRLRLRVQADQPGFDLCAALSLVDRDGRRSRQLCTGVLRVLGPGAMDPLERCVHLQPLAATLQPGERLRLCLAPAAWPHLAVNGGDGRQPSGGPTARHRIITLLLQPADAELVVFPLLPGETDGEDATLAAN